MVYRSLIGLSKAEQREAILDVAQMRRAQGSSRGFSDEEVSKAVVSYVRRMHNLLIGEATANRILDVFGVATAPFEGLDESISIEGRDLIASARRKINFSRAELGEVIEDLVSTDDERTVRSTAEDIALAQMHASPQPRLARSGKLAMGPNPVSDQPADPVVLPGAAREMLLLLPALLDSLLANHPRIIASNLASYHAELRDNWRDASWGALDRLIRNAETSFRGADPREFEDGLRAQCEDVFKLHDTVRSSLRDADKRFNAMVSIVVDEAAMGQAIAQPVDDLRAAADVLKAASLTEPSFDTGMGALVDQGRDQEYPPPPVTVPAPVAMPIGEHGVDDAALDTVPVLAVSSRKAWIFGALGVAKETYNLIGSPASIAALPAVIEAGRLLEHAIEGLLALIL